MANKVVGFSIEIKGQKQIQSTTKLLGLLNTQLILVGNTLQVLEKQSGKGLENVAKEFKNVTDSAEMLGAVVKTSFKSFEDGNDIIKDLGNGFFETSEEIDRTSKSIADLKEENKELKQFLEEAPREGEEGYEELADALDLARQQFTENREAILSFNKELRTGQKESEIAEGSILDLRNEVKELTKQYNALGKEAREGTEGKEIQKNLKETVAELKTLEEAVGDNRRSVGDYKRAFEGLGGVFGPFRAGLEGVRAGFNLLVKNPLLAVLTAIVSAVTGLIAAFRSTKEGAEAFARASAAVGAVLDVVRDVAVSVGKGLVSIFTDPIGSIKAFGTAIKDGVVSVLGGVVNLVTAVGSGIKSLVTLDFEGLKQAGKDAGQVLQNGFNNAVDAANQLTNAVGATADEIQREAAEAARLTGILQDLTDTQRNLAVQRAQLNAQLTETRAISRDTTKTLQERIQALNDVREAERTQLAFELDAQQKRVDALKALRSLSDSTPEQLNEIAQAEIQLANIRKQSASSEISIQRELDRLTNERNKKAEAERKRKEQEAEDEEKARAKLLEDIENDNIARITLINELNDELKEVEIENIEDLTKAAIEAENLRFERQSEARKKNLEQVIKDAKEQAARAKEILGATSDEFLAFQENQDAQLKAIKDKNRQLEEEAAKEHQENLTAIQKEGEDKRKEGILKGFAAVQNAIKEGQRAFTESLSETLEEGQKKRKEQIQNFISSAQEIANAAFNLISTFTEIANEAENARLENAIAAREESISKLNDELQDATGLQKIFLEQQLKNEQKALEEETKAKEKAEKEQAEQQKAIAIVTAVINTALAVSQALAGSPPPASFILAAVAAAAGIAQVAAISAQKFAEGGLITGPSHAQGGVPFTVAGAGGFEAEGGEAIINKRSTSMFKPLLSAINQAGGGKRFQAGGIVGTPISAPALSGASNDLNKTLSSFDARTEALSSRIDNITVTQDLNNLQDIQNNDSNLNVLTTFN